jgi:histidine triad (HIT) family protein
MYNHSPNGYTCPICLGVKGVESNETLICKSDIVFKDDLVTAFIGSFFIEGNHGSVIIVPNEHFENIYDLPNKYAHRIAEIAQKAARAVRKTYPSDGITILQNNESDANQHAFHYHLHVFPRYKSDRFFEQLLKTQKSTPEERQQYADKVKKELSTA